MDTGESCNILLKIIPILARCALPALLGKQLIEVGIGKHHFGTIAFDDDHDGIRNVDCQGALQTHRRGCNVSVCTICSSIQNGIVVVVVVRASFCWYRNLLFSERDLVDSCFAFFPSFLPFYHAWIGELMLTWLAMQWPTAIWFDLLSTPHWLLVEPRLNAPSRVWCEYVVCWKRAPLTGFHSEPLGSILAYMYE